ncbi:MAG: DMT family transporter [Chloroflexota bacterium]
MSALAIVLVLCAALLHATWNFLAKRCYGGVTFVWLYSLIATIIYAPLIVILFLTTSVKLGAPQLIFIGVSSVLQLVYLLLLTRAYQVADLSLVYPLARGTGPMLSTIAAVIFFGERPTPLAVAGAFLIVTGVFFLTGDPRKLRAAGATPGVTLALLTGVTIASYTLWDKQAVSDYYVPPLLLNWGVSLVHTIVLIPVIRSRWAGVQREWHDNRYRVIGVSILAPLAYILVLTALSFSPVSYVAPMRECSVLIGTILGARLLAEGDTRRRLAGAGIIVFGVIMIGLG